MWVTFLIPKIEDGNNFGVSIQEDTLGEIRAVEGEAATFYDAIARYHINRGKIISKVCIIQLSPSKENTTCSDLYLMFTMLTVGDWNVVVVSCSN